MVEVASYRENDVGPYNYRIGRPTAETNSCFPSGWEGLQKALSEQGNPKFESVNAIMHALGYHLKPEKHEMLAGR